MDEILQFVLDESLVMIPALWILGVIIKHTNILDNRWIPVVLLGVSAILTPLILDGYTAKTIVQAIYVTGVAVFGHQLIKQTIIDPRKEKLEAEQEDTD